MALVKFRGVEIQLGGRDFIVPALTLGQLRTLQPRLDGLGTAPQSEQMATMLDAIHAAVARNYPEIDQAELEGLIDLSDLQTVFAAVMGISGLEKTQGKA